MDRRQIAVSPDTILDSVPFHGRSRFVRAVVDSWLDDMTGAYQAMRQTYSLEELMGLFAAAGMPASRVHETDYAMLSPVMRGLLAKLDWACEVADMEPAQLIDLLESGRRM